MSIKTTDICRYYTVGNTSVRALDGISISISDGEYVTIAGASGSGKSTLMNILGCLDSPSGGRYELDGSDVSALSDDQLSEIRNEKIGFIFQSFNLVAGLSAAENVELPLMYRGIPRRERHERALQALEKVSLSNRAQHKPSELSGGQQQRVAIARAIAASPSIILADEPCGNLDSRSGSEVMDILAELNRAGKTVIMITHDENAAKKAQRLIRISDGKIIC